jgi:hypothetical protein
MGVSEKSRMRLRLINQILLYCVCFLILCSCATEKAYREATSQWKSYEDVAKWMSNNFRYDFKRLEATTWRGPSVVPPRSAGETFKIKSGVCYDAAVFARDTLNRINPSYKAKVLFLECRPGYPNHYVCVFHMNGKFYVIDYGHVVSNVMGVHGPYDSIKEYVEFYEKIMIGVHVRSFSDVWNF